MKPEPLFYIEREEQQIAGPYDVVQLAGLLRKKIITPETMTALKGTEDWKPFSWQPQFSVVKELPPDAVSMRVDELEEASLEANSPAIPLPSRETVMKLGGLLCGCLFAFLVALFFGWLDKTTGTCLMVAGGCAAVVAQCLMMAKLLDENFWTLFLVFFIPGGDIYYFLSNIWQYFSLFCVKYVGLAVLAGALIGVATHSTH